MVLEKILESPFDSREIKPVNPKRSSQSGLKEINPEYSLEVLMLRLKLILWLLDAKRCLARKNPDAGIV